MSYKVLARKYRPRYLQDIKGQEVLVRSLNFAIQNSRLPHVILLTGIRGVGKTTAARIIASTINCTNKIIEEQNVKSCFECKNCKNYLDSKHPDIIEMDAASNTGVDDMRSVINSAEYMPMMGKYRVFIIDEAHMLSKNAFNAMLKVIEEPPSHVLFILATTEVNKLPVTIISRCQRFDLKRFTSLEIISLLKKICEKEKIKIDDPALNIIASRSEGSARDALSLLDQSSSIMLDLKKEIIDEEIIVKMIGSSNINDILNLFRAVFKQDLKESIKISEELYSSNPDMNKVLELMIELLVYAIKQKSIKEYISYEYLLHKEQINLIFKDISVSFLTIAYQIMTSSLEEMKIIHNSLITFEMTIIKIIHSSNIPYPHGFIDLNHDNKNINNKTSFDSQYTKKSSISNILEENIKKNLPENIIANHIDKENNPEDKKKINLKSGEKSFEEFLHFLFKSKEIKLYYFLLNDAELSSMVNNILEINSKSSDRQIIEELQNMLYTFTDNKWSVIINRKERINSYKYSLKEKFFLSESYKNIKEVFDKTEIKDILIKVEN